MYILYNWGVWRKNQNKNAQENITSLERLKFKVETAG